MAVLEKSFHKRAPMSGRFGRGVLLPFGLAVLGIVVWEVLCVRMRVPLILLPPPSAVWQVLRNNYAILLGQAMPTASESVLSFAIASALGVALAVSLTYSVWVREALYPNIVMFQLIPKIALAPLFVVWLGVGEKTSTVVAVFIGFFPVVVSSATGLVSASPRRCSYAAHLPPANGRYSGWCAFPTRCPSSSLA